ncbi:MAG: ABC transporter permease [Synergistaceae bacterium]|jgi:simple sugar transport system permease protein|nr:ABC transporter permease [Synergistaceae bacterium]
MNKATNEDRRVWVELRDSIFRERRTVGLLVVLVALAFVMSLLNPRNFPTIPNMRSMMLQMAETGIFTLAMFVIMISGGLNLSIVSAANFSAACMASVVTGKIFTGIESPAGKVAVGVALAICVGALCGSLNGFFVSKLRLNALLVTTASSQLFEGAAQLITKGGSIVNSQIPSITTFGNGAVFGVLPNAFLMTLACYVAAALFVNNTKYGENSRLLGANETATLYCGNNNVRTLMTAYMLSGIFSAVGGITVFAKMGIVRSEYGSSLSSQALLTLVFAGLMIVGGTGKVFNVILSLVILQMVASGFNLARLTAYSKSLCWGVMLMFIVIMSTPQAEGFFRVFGKLLGSGKKGGSDAGGDTAGARGP